jgi:chromate transporter
VRALAVVFDPPSLNSLSGVREAQEPVLVEAFIPELAVEAFDVRIVMGLPGRMKLY